MTGNYGIDIWIRCDIMYTEQEKRSGQAIPIIAYGRQPSTATVH